MMFLCAVVATLQAQVSVEARLDSIEILIGQQTHLTLTVTASDGANVVFPTYQRRDTLVAGVEVIASGDVSRKKTVEGMIQSQRTYTLTSFDGRLYYLPPVAVRVDGKEHRTQSLALKVMEIEVDTTRVDEFFGPKDVQDNPFLWSDWSTAFWLSVLMLLLIAVDTYLYIRAREGKPVISSLKLVKRLLPHQKAMKAIEAIKAENMVNSADQKEYYTRLTDALRKYIEERYGFSAMEMTSGEIIQRLTEQADQQSMDELRQLFATADLVKFAKYSTLINENDMNLVNAIEFINQTKIDTPPAEAMERPVLSEADQRTLKTRRILRASIIVIAAASAVLLAVVLWQLYLLIA